MPRPHASARTDPLRRWTISGAAPAFRQQPSSSLLSPMPSGLARREALWAIKPLRDEPLPLFAAVAGRETEVLPEQAEPSVSLRPMASGREVVEDYGHVGLTLRQHPVSFLRAELALPRILTCAEAIAYRDRRWVHVAGLVLVRQRPGSAKGIMFITLEDETAVANLVVWTKVFEKFRRVVLGSGMIGVMGRVQREGEVVHIVAHEIIDMSAELASIGSIGTAFPLPHGRGDEFHHGSPTPDPRGLARPRDMPDPSDHIDKIRVRTRDFR
jgi:error-prone DNA polymerase